jgi:hypothetical protein
MATISLVDRMRPTVDATMSSLAAAQFRIDPIGGEPYSLATSIVSAAYKRHGRILEEAIRMRLSDCPYFTVWSDESFIISHVADHALTGRNADIEDSLPIELPYLDHSGRIIQVDVVLFDRRVSSVRGYEIKRANGYFDAGKKRSILKSYASKRGHIASIAEARLIAYYGVKPLPDPLCISGDEIDDHFAFLVKRYVDEVNEYFKEQLYAFLKRVTGLPPELDKSALCDRCPLQWATD